MCVCVCACSRARALRSGIAMKKDGMTTIGGAKKTARERKQCASACIVLLTNGRRGKGTGLSSIYLSRERN